MPTDRSIVTLRPTLRVNGRAYDRLSELLLALRMVESEGGMSGLEVRLLDIASDPQGGADDAFDDERIVALGSPIEVYAGEETSPQEVFRGRVTALEYSRDEANPPELTLHAEDALQRARMTRRTKVFEDATLADIASQIAQSAGLTPQVTGLSESLGVQVQLDESDLAFLRRLLALRGADMQVVGQELQVAARSDVTRGTVALAFGEALLSARVTADLADQASEVTVSGWDVAQGSRINERSDGSGFGPGSGRTGASILEEKFARRAEHLGQLAAVATSDEARAVASAALAKRARRFVRVDATATGDPRIRVGTHVQITGLPKRWNNTYYVVRVEHRYDRVTGYQTRFEAECAWLGAV